MSSKIETQVRNLLFQYPYRDLAIDDTLSTLRNFPHFSLSNVNYTYNDGREACLFCMVGTIPVVYKGATYNIPICVYLEKNYPHQAPICFVRPTSFMILKETIAVKPDGEVKLSYLSEWRHPQSDLTTLLQVLCLQFADEMPVYSKKTTSASPQTSLSSYSVSTQSSYQRQQYPTSNPSGNLPYPSNSSYSMPQPNNPGHYPSNSTSGPIGYPPYTPNPQCLPYPSQQSNNGNQPNNENIVYQSLVSSVGDKIRRRLNNVLGEGKIEIDKQKHIENELKKSSSSVADKLKRLKEQEDRVESEIKIMSSKVMELHELETSLNAKQSKLEIDDAVITPTPLYTQILNLHAEECAIEDTIYYFGEALRREVIDLEVFLKHVRSLSRKQFMLRALIRKARITARLP